MRHIPNILCICRILLVLPLLMCLIEHRYAWACVIFAVAGATDGLDGYLARRFDWRSQLGGILDPIADKFLIVSVFLVLAAIKLVPSWLAILIIGRDLLIVIGVVSYRVLVGPITGDASLVSKFNTACLLLFVLCVISQAGFDIPSSEWVLILGAVVFATTLVSGLDYIREGIKRFYNYRIEVVQND